MCFIIFNVLLRRNKQWMNGWIDYYYGVRFLADYYALCIIHTWMPAGNFLYRTMPSSCFVPFLLLGLLYFFKLSTFIQSFHILPDVCLSLRQTSGNIQTSQSYCGQKIHASIILAFSRDKQVPPVASTPVGAVYAHYGRPPASWPTAIIFYCWCFYPLTFFSPANLGGLWADRHQTSPHVRWWL